LYCEGEEEGAYKYSCTRFAQCLAFLCCFYLQLAGNDEPMNNREQVEFV
jgi:hypothetical protein